LNERDRPATIPQAKPLSPGEVLGCTAPTDLGHEGDGAGSLNSKTTEHVMLFIADGRFHLEAAMIANPTLRALRYDPYSKTLTEEFYENEKMKSIRLSAIRRAMDPSVRTYGIILGTLGRQGNPAILGHIRSLLKKHNKKYFILLLSEIFPKKLDLFSHVDAWVQIACPRLSIDWGHFFTTPILSPYELNVALGEAEFYENYPMDFYKEKSGRWSNYNEGTKHRQLTNAVER
jgi:2-(3-amino-3-carboxypropyl)histidine synthase